MRRVPDGIHSLIPPHTAAVFALIWTTTPWTLPVNQAVCFNPDLSYSLVSIDERSGEVYVIATELVEMLQQKLCRPIKIVATFPGEVV
jgi:isoleucyl-tRNA synthetase